MDGQVAPVNAFTLAIDEVEADGLGIAIGPVDLEPGQRVYLAVPGDSEAVHQRLYDAVGVWLVNTPQILQSAASLSRAMMDALVRDDD